MLAIWLGALDELNRLKRRDFITLLSGSAVALQARTQQSGWVRRINSRVDGDSINLRSES
jgi:hypothetical protein